MGNFFGIIIFIVIGIASAAQKRQEAKQKKGAAARQMERESSTTRTTTVRQARPKGAGSKGPASLSPGTSGKELVTALFGEGAAEKMEGWTQVPPLPGDPKAKQASKPQRAPQRVQRHDESVSPREEAMRQREAMEQQYARDNDHSSRGHARGVSHQPQRQAQPAQQQHTEEERRRIHAERQRRKAQQQQQKRQKQQKAQQQRPPRRAVVAPLARTSIIPASMPDMRRAIVMAEILGSPKAFE